MILQRTTSITLLLTLWLAGCGGGGGGGGAAPAAPTPLATGTFVKTVELPDAGQGDWIGLFRTGPGNRRFQFLVRAKNLNGSGPISALSLRFGGLGSTGNSCPDVTIKMGHTSKSTLDSTTFADNVEQGRGSLVTVFPTGTLTIPGGALGGAYFTIPLAGAFHYNGVDNLVVEIAAGACTDNTVLMARAATTPYTTLIWNVTDSTAVTGATWNALAHMRFTFAGGGDVVTYTAGAGFTPVPLTTLSSLQKSQFLYLATEINGSGAITGVAFPIGNTSTAQDYTVTVKLGHTNLSNLTLTYANNFNVGAPVTVANAVSLHVPGGMPVGSHLWIPFPDGIFDYNGINNLVVEIDVSSATGNTFWVVHNSPGGRLSRLLGSSGATIGGGVDTVANDIKFRFQGGTMDVLTPDGMQVGSDVDGFPFSASSGKRQYLYLASELGTEGSITKIACRVGTFLGNAFTAATYPGYQVVMGHTSANTLTTEYANNITVAATVFSGDVAVPDNLAGDWLEIPLSSPFSYNGKDNLVVQISGAGGGADNLCILDTDPALYASRHLLSSNPSDTAGSLGDFLMDMRFFLQ